jgi:thiamine-phosphate pyrophosphorylase
VNLPDPPLLLITERRLSPRPLEETVACALQAGCRWVSLREKDLEAEARLALLRRLVALGRRFGAVIGVHEDIEGALAAGALAVHLPAKADPATARVRLPAGMLLGVSAHDAAELARAGAAGFDYATLSPIFPSASKPGYGPALGREGLARIAVAAAIPVLALGGIDCARIAACIDAGAAGVAVMGGIMAADDPGKMMTAMIDRLGAALAARGPRRS